MKIFYLQIPGTDFAAFEDVWTSPVIDLYSNGYYKNFSSTKSNFGTNLLGTGVWTGLSGDDGIVQSGRYIDTTGRIDLVNYFITTPDDVVVALPNTLQVYAAHSATAMFPDEWVKTDGFISGDDLNIVDTQRYVRFVVSFQITSNIDYDFDFWARIQIDRPVMSPFYERARNVTRKFPSWMDINEQDTPATPIAVPASVGGQFINAVAGEWLDDIDSQLLYQNLQRYIGTVDLNQKAWVYRADAVPETVSSITGIGVADGRGLLYGELTRCSLDEFYLLNNDEDGTYWDELTQTVFVNKNYADVQVNGVSFSLVLHPVWNSLDDIGLLADLHRLSGESNQDFKTRILDVYIHPLGVGVEEFKNALRRELSLWQYFGSTPNSDFDGALPDIVEISDMKLDPLFWSAEGLPTPKFVHLMDELSRTFPNTWGRFKYGEQIWDLGGPNHEGFDVIPYRFDATPPSDHLQSGVGDGIDLLIDKPDQIPGSQVFNATVQVKGFQRSTDITLEWPTIEFDISLIGAADQINYINIPFTQWLSVEITAGGIVYIASAPFDLVSDFSIDHPDGTDNSYVMWKIFNEDGFTAEDVFFLRKTTGALYPGVVINTNDISSVVLKAGQWNVGTQTYVNVGAFQWSAWWGYDPTTLLSFTDGFTTHPTITGGAWSPVVIYPQEQFSDLSVWTSAEQIYHVTLNGAMPGMVPQSYTLSVPDLFWSNFLATPPNKVLEVSFVTLDEDGNAVVNTKDGKGNPLTLPADNFIVCNGFSSWTSTINEIDIDDGLQLVFTSQDINGYPVPAEVWTAFEVDLPPVQGVVDENGPWRNGVPSHPGNTNDHFLWKDLSRTDLSIPNTSDYLITWMGVVSDNPNVITWMDSNTVVNSISNSVQLNGTTQYAIAPTTNRLDIPGDFEITAFIALDQWASGALPQTIISKTSPGEYSWFFQIDRFGNLVLQVSQNGIGVFGGVATVPLDLLPGTAFWVRATMQQLSGHNIFHFYGSPDGITWTKLDDDSNDTVEVVSIFSGNAPVQIGARQNDSGSNIFFLKGRVYYVEVRDGIDGEILLSPWFRTPPVNSTTYSANLTEVTDPQDNTFTLVGGALIEPSPAPLPGQIVNYFDGSFTSFPVYAKLRKDIPLTWSPRVNAGYFYDKYGEYYLYAQEGATPVVAHATPSQLLLPTNAQQGAPIVVQSYLNATPSWMTRINFFDATPGDFTKPPALSTVNTEIKTGNNTNSFWLAYTDIYGVTVQDLATNLFINVSQIQENKITVAAVSNPDHQYKISYSVHRSFYADNDWFDTTTQSLRTKLVFDRPLASNRTHKIFWEESFFDSATPTPLQLSPLYSALDEGFIYISHDEYPLDQLLTAISPSTIVADGTDHLVINVNSVDRYGNPKPNQSVHISTTWGYLATPSQVQNVVTNSDGYAHAMLLADSSAVSPSGTLTLTSGAVTRTVPFQVRPIPASNYRLTLKPSIDEIPADGQSTLYVIGRIEDPVRIGVPNANVNWSRARSLYDLYADSATPETGVVFSDLGGMFNIGPFTAASPDSPGYWFLQASAGTPSGGATWQPVGDIVYWHEYPYYIYGIENLHTLPKAPFHMATPVLDIPFASNPIYPSQYYEDQPYGSPEGATPNWAPPLWVPMSAFDQYQLGLSGSNPDSMTIAQYQGLHPFKRDI